MDSSNDKKITVKEAVRQTYTALGKEFSTNTLISNVRELVERPALHDGTILRALRRLKGDGILDYEVIDQHKSIYRKKEDTPEGKKQLKLFDV